MADGEVSKPTTRRLSFRRSLVETDLPTGYLDALEQKRKALDDSIHKYIASKEREFKQYERELRLQAKRHEVIDGTPQPDNKQVELAEATALQSAVGKDTRHRVYDNTAENDFGNKHDGAMEHGPAKKREDSPGLFTPDYLSALAHPLPQRTSSEPLTVASKDEQPPRLTTRTNADSAAQAQRPARLLLTQRTSSSGSSVDGRLISALKSSTESVPKSRQKRVSLAVGDTIVAPSDSVPLSMSTNSTSSHSRSRSTSSRNAIISAALADVVRGVDDTPAISSAIQILQEEGSVSAATASMNKERPRIEQTRAPSEDVGDMFDLEDEDVAADYDDDVNMDASPDEPMNSEVIGRVSSFAPDHIVSDIQEAPDIQKLELGEPPPDTKDISKSTALMFAEGASSAQQPLSPGFRRPSAILDPMYGGSDYRQAEEDVEDTSFYGSSFSRNSKGSFTSSSLGESYMARNAEKLMEMRAQHQQERPQQSRQSTHVMPVR